VNTDAPLNVLVDPIRDRLRQGGGIDLLALALAAWMRRVRGEDEQGNKIDVRHPLAEILREKAIQGGADPRPLLSIERLFGELAQNEGFIAVLSKWLKALYENGAAKVLLQAERELSL